MNVVILIVTIVIISLLYGVYKKQTNKSDEERHYELVREYLLNDSPLAQNKNPIIWIHLDYKINARDWKSFNSRNTRNLNQPYVYLTIKSIVDKCGKDFKICVIDDNTFVNLLPNWNVDLELVAEPIKSKLRTLALMNVLNIYGGMLLPSTFYCGKSLKPLYDEFTKDNKMFVGDSINRNVTANDNKLCVTNKVIGCNKDCNIMQGYINYLQILVSSDNSDESNFLGSQDMWLENKMREKKINLLDSKYLGLTTDDDKIITLDNLLSEGFTDLHTEAFGIYIPGDEILKRTKYQWFARMSPQQVLSSNTFIGKFMISNLITEEEYTSMINNKPSRHESII